MSNRAPSILVDVEQMAFLLDVDGTLLDLALPPLLAGVAREAGARALPGRNRHPGARNSPVIPGFGTFC
jgi:hypothetical protein